MAIRHSIRDSVANVVPMRHRRRIARARVRVRQSTARIRALPDFFVIGTELGGTSSLFKYLQRHPAIRSSLRKETEFFDRYPHRGMDWYRAHFPVEALMGSRLAFEATPSYMVHPRVPEKLSAVIPDARFIVLLRDPIARALSGWRHYRELGFESLSFKEAIEGESERIAGELERMSEDADYYSKPYIRFGYLHKGLYADQLERWFKWFPRARFFIARSEGLYADPHTFVCDVSAFLGIEAWGPGDARRYGSATSSTQFGQRLELDEATLKHLALYFGQPNQRLIELLGTRFNWS